MFNGATSYNYNIIFLITSKHHINKMITKHYTMEVKTYNDCQFTRVFFCNKNVSINKKFRIVLLMKIIIDYFTLIKICKITKKDFQCFNFNILLLYIQMALLLSIQNLFYFNSLT